MNPLAYRPFEPAVTPMDASVRAFELVGDGSQFGHRLADALVIRDGQPACPQADPRFPPGRLR
jgi:hypothetical protein